jgi:hypothetical protein
MCRQHANTAHYTAVNWVANGTWAPNHFLHNNAVAPATARRIERLLTGGQELRGGDPKGVTTVSVYNCCVFCLERGHKTIESLTHVTFRCPAYEALRQGAGIKQELLRRNAAIFRIHRHWWKWRQLKDVRTYFEGLLHKRDGLAGGRGRGLQRRLQTRAEAAWGSGLRR